MFVSVKTEPEMTVSEEEAILGNIPGEEDMIRKIERLTKQLQQARTPERMLDGESEAEKERRKE